MYLQVKEGEFYMDSIELIIGTMYGAPPYSSDTINKMAEEAIEMLKKANRYKELANNEAYLEVHGEDSVRWLLRESKRLKENGDKMLRIATIKQIELLNEDNDDGGDSRWMRWNIF